MYSPERLVRIHSILMRLHYGVYISLAAVLSGALAGSGCDRRPAKRTYHEIVQSAPQPQARPMIPAFGEARPEPDGSGRPMMAVRLPMGGAVDQQTQKMLEASVARPPLSWATPEGWQESPGSGMRLATFRSADTGDPVECALISLAGDAGGVESNAARWMQQVNIAVPDVPAMEKFLAAQKKIKTRDGFDATILDLTQLQSQDDLESPSMAATIITLPDMTVFVKMTGARGAVLKNRDQFEALCESLKLN